MSVKHITEVVQLEGITPTQKLILFIIANYSDEFGQAYPSHGRIMKISCLSRSAVIKNLNKLKEDGYIDWENRNDTSNLYTLTFNRGVSQKHRGVSQRYTILKLILNKYIFFLIKKFLRSIRRNVIKGFSLIQRTHT